MVIPKENVFLFIGDDAYLKEKALQKLRASLLGKAADGSDQKIFCGYDLDPQEVFDCLTTLPLLSEKRLIVIRDIEDISDDLKKNLISYIQKPLPSVYLVLDAHDDDILEDYSAVSKHITIQRFGIPRGGSLSSWITEFLASQGKTIAPDALMILRELEGNDLSYLAQELEKLVTFIGSRKEIKVSDVEEIVGKSLILSAFGITDALNARDASEALKIVSCLIALGKKESEIIGLLSWHLKRLLRAKILKTGGESDYTVGSLLKIGQRFQRDFFKQLADFKLEKLRRDIQILLQADLNIKRTKFDPGTILEFTLIQLCLL